jgi:hypothetical protein
VWLYRSYDLASLYRSRCVPRWNLNFKRRELAASTRSEKALGRNAMTSTQAATLVARCGRHRGYCSAHVAMNAISPALPATACHTAKALSTMA